MQHTPSQATSMLEINSKKKMSVQYELRVILFPNKNHKLAWCSEQVTLIEYYSFHKYCIDIFCLYDRNYSSESLDSTLQMRLWLALVCKAITRRNEGLLRVYLWVQACQQRSTVNWICSLRELWNNNKVNYN